MYHFFVTPSQVEGETIYIEGSDVNHMKNVLRMRPGERLAVSDGNNCRYLCEIRSFEAKEDETGGNKPFRAVLHVISTEEEDRELPSRIYLFQGLPKQEKMELIVQKCVELGAYEVIPVAMKRCVVRLDEKKAKKKTERWQQIAESAAKQAGRGIVPRVADVLSYKDALERAKELDVFLFPYELAEGMAETKKVIRAIRPGQSVGIFIGPEGGFEKEEVEFARKAGAKEITLGKRILRTETAGLSIISVLMFHLERE